MPLSQFSVTKIVMGMPVCVKIISENRVPRADFSLVFNWFAEIDAQFSTYKPDSEVSRINRGLPRERWTRRMHVIVALCDAANHATQGYFDAYHAGRFDPSGLVKGWAIREAANKLLTRGYGNWAIEAGGDMQLHGANAESEAWKVGIRNPFHENELVKVLKISHNEGVATSGAYIRGQHIYNPLEPNAEPAAFSSVTVIGPDVFEADRYATAVYAMGEAGASFIAAQSGFEAYCVRPDNTAVMTPGIARYIA